MRRTCRSIGGFTLVELLVVLGIIVTLISILLPVIGQVGEMSRRTVCLSNLRQLGAASITYAADHDGYLPIRPHNAPWAPQVPYWPAYSSTDVDTRPLWVGYLPGYTIENSSPFFYCPSNDNDSTLLNSHEEAWSVMLPGVYIFGYAYFGAYHRIELWKGSVPPARRVRDKATPIFADITESYLYSTGQPWFYAAHTRYGGVQWLAPGSAIAPQGMNCVSSDGSARWYVIRIDPATQLPTLNSEVEPCINVSQPGFYWGKPGI